MSLNWLAFALISTSCFSATVVLDKFLLSRYVRQPLAYLIALIIFQQIFAVLIFAAKGHGFVYPESIFALIAGCSQVLLWVSYLKALQIEEASRISSMVFVYPAFVLAGAAIFLGESLSAREVAGSFLLIASAILVSNRPPGENASGSNIRSPVFLSPVMRYMVAFWVLTASYALAAKYLLSFMDEWHLYAWSSIGNLITAIPLLANGEIRAATLRVYRRGTKLIGAVALEETLDFLGRIASIFGYAFGSVTLVSSVGALQPFITLLFVFLLSFFLPGALEEEMGRRTILQKLAAVVLIAAGVYLIS